MNKNKNIGLVLDLNKTTQLLPFLTENQILGFLSNMEKHGFLKQIDISDKKIIKSTPITKTKMPSIEVFMNHALLKLQSHPVKLNDEEIESFKFEVSSKYESYVSNGWRDGNNKPIKNWKNTVNNQMKWLVKNCKIALANGKNQSIYTSKEIFDLFIQDAQGKFKRDISELYHKHSLMKGALYDLTKEFDEHLVNMNIIHPNTDDYLRHFKNWLKKKDESQKLSIYKKYKNI